jgi:hypothetical protein
MRAEPRVWAEAAQLLDWGFAATAAGARPVGALPPLPPPVEPEEPAAEAAAEAVGDAVGAAVQTVSDAAVTSAAASEQVPGLPGRELAGGDARGGGPGGRAAHPATRVPAP